jgi:hypothetical protein
MSDVYDTGSEGERLLADYLTTRGRVVRRSDRKTFDLIVDDQYAEVKSSRGPYSSLGFIGLTEAQRAAMLAGVEFTIFVVCNVANPTALEVIEIPSTLLLVEEPKVERIHYWYRTQLERCRNAASA